MSRKYVLCGLFAGLTAICAWLSVPLGSVTFTLQTFAVFLALELLGGKWGTVSILCYLLLGAVGLPVFSGFRGGFSALLGATGGFLWGFLPMGLCYWAFEKVCRPLGSVLGLLLCYLCGGLWLTVCAGGMDFAAALAVSVLPYILPDGLKLLLARAVASRVRKSLRI